MRASLRSLLDLYDSAGRGSIHMLEVLAGKKMAAGSWSVHSGSVYKQAAAFTFDGHVRPVVVVRCSIAPYVLTRVEAIADVVAGSWFWDDAAASPELYLRLPDSSNPSGAVVEALLLFCFSTRRIVHPLLGPDKLTDGGLELWDASNDPTHWTPNASGTGWTCTRDPAIAPTGRYSARIQGVDVTSGQMRLAITANPSCVVGAMYRAAGWYMTDPAFSSGLEARLDIGTAVAGFLDTDGRHLVGTPPILQPTQGELRRYGFDFVAHTAAPNYRPALYWLSGTASGSLWLDGMSLQRIHRWIYYDPRLSADSIPQVEQAMAARGFGGKRVGVGEARISNADGVYDSIFGQLVLHGKSAVVCVGGEFPDGQTIGREDCRISYPGVIQDPDGDDRFYVLHLEATSALKTTLPLDKYKLADFSNMELNREGYARPLAFGKGNHGGPAIRYIRPTRIAADATTQYGEYEVLDASDSPAGVEAMTVHTFLTNEDRDGVI